MILDSYPLYGWEYVGHRGDWSADVLHVDFSYENGDCEENGAGNEMKWLEQVEPSLHSGEVRRTVVEQSVFVHRVNNKLLGTVL